MATYYKQHTKITFILSLFITFLSTGRSQNIDLKKVDFIVKQSMESFHVPGMAVGIIEKGRIIYMQGHGVRSIKSGLEINERTLFGIASNTKAFTAAALGILVQEGKAQWDDKVISYIPEFKMYDSITTRELSLRDLLCHRCGLNAGAGDLMIWPDSALFTRKEALFNLRFLKPVTPLRSKYAYNNLMFLVAGEVIERISKVSWEQFVEERIMGPLGMKDSKAAFCRLPDTSNIIDAHAADGNQAIWIPRNYGNLVNPAGGIYSNLSDLCKWVGMLLEGGSINNKNEELISEEVIKEMWSPQTTLSLSSPGPYNSTYSAYGLGWRIRDVMGQKQVSHTGALAGMCSQITLLPESGTAIIVLTNQQTTYSHQAVTQGILDLILGINGKDRVKENLFKQQQEIKDANVVVHKIWEKAKERKDALPNPATLTGCYQDPWLGNAQIVHRCDTFFFHFEKAPRFSGELVPYRDKLYIVKWKERSLEADAFIEFKMNTTGNAVGFRMWAFSPLADFSYDFEDLEFSRIEQ